MATVVPMKGLACRRCSGDGCPDCLWSGHRQVRIERDPEPDPKPERVECGNCGLGFDPAAGAGRRYCSIECRREAQWAENDQAQTARRRTHLGAIGALPLKAI